mgnify:CR=1 FL=1
MKQLELVMVDAQVTWMVSGVIITFAVCWLPLNICFALTASAYPHQVSKSQAFIIAQIFSQVSNTIHLASVQTRYD